MTRYVKPDIMLHFSNSLLLNIYNLLGQVYALAKFHPCMPTTFGVTTLQSSNNRKIDLYSKYWENILQAITKMAVTYKRNAVQSCNLHHHVRHEYGSPLLGKFSFYHLSLLHTETKSVKKDRLRTIAST